MRIPALFILLAFFSIQAASAGTNLHVMSYNIKGLPSAILSGDYKDARYGLIGQLLKKRELDKTAPDVVVLQEAFSDATKALITEAGYPHVSDGPPSVSVLGVNSGLYILSRYKILKSSHVAFGPQHCLSWDCFSNKGVQMARLEVPGLPRPLEIFNTHMQAGREDTAARQAQVKILLEFFKAEHEDGNPVIFAGDFNFRPGLGQKSYKDFAAGMGFGHAGKFCLDKGCADGKDDGWHGLYERAVDHQFFSVKGQVTFTPVRVSRSYREPVEGMKLSDHPAHEVRYELSWGERELASKDKTVKHPVPPRKLGASVDTMVLRGGGPLRQKLFTEPARRGTSVP